MADNLPGLYSPVTTANTQRRHNIVTTSLQRHDVVKTLCIYWDTYYLYQKNAEINNDELIL